MLPINNTKYQIQMSRAAFEQISLILDNDYTIDGMNFRLKIGGKGCDGFTYETGFSESKDDDIILEYKHGNKVLTLIADPFTAHYCRDGDLDYIFDPNGQEGFTFTNANEHLYHGKFFKDETLLPPEDLIL